MPGVKRGKDKEESEVDEGEQEQESESERSSEEELSSSEGSDSEESSELNLEECDKRRDECLVNMNELQRQFSLLTEQLYKERITQVEAKLEEVKQGNAKEYLDHLDELKEGLRVRLEVLCVLRQMRLQCIKNKYESEIAASKQNFENEKLMLWDSIESDLEEKIRHLEEDRNSVDVNSQVWAEQNLNRKHKRHRYGSNSSNEHRRKKPTTVSGPYIVYMLKEADILEDWTTIKRALTNSKLINKISEIKSLCNVRKSSSLKKTSLS